MNFLGWGIGWDEGVRNSVPEVPRHWHWGDGGGAEVWSAQSPLFKVDSVARANVWLLVHHLTIFIIYVHHCYCLYFLECTALHIPGLPRKSQPIAAL